MEWGNVERDPLGGGTLSIAAPQGKAELGRCNDRSGEELSRLRREGVHGVGFTIYW